jgi:hypothetical protein
MRILSLQKIRNIYDVKKSSEQRKKRTFKSITLNFKLNFGYMFSFNYGNVMHELIIYDI